MSWGYTAMFWWTDRYRPVTVPNYDQFGTLLYYGIGLVRKLTAFSVPAFLFVSGLFVAYAARGSRSTLSWKVVKVRLTNLLVPYTIWSVVIFVGDFLQGTTHTPVEYLRRLVFGGAAPPYFYVPLLCQLYLLSPLLVTVAKTRGRQLLLVSALVLLSMISLGYLNLYGIVVGMEMPVVDRMRALLPPSSFVRWIFFFVLGVVSGLHLRQLKQWLARFRWHLLVAAIVLAILAVLEAEVIFHSTGVDWWRSTPFSIPASLYAVGFILCFLAFDKIPIPFSRLVRQIGKVSFGIYLLHWTVLQFAARAIQEFTPWLLAPTALFLSVLVILAVGLPLSFTTAVARSPLRRYYRYLFG
jgi:peptidoglycan/LPS O-acetylase OafA/YrhL